MNDRKKYYTLDDIGFIGVQEKRSAAYEKKIQRKTGEIIRKRREADEKAALLKKKVKPN